MKASTWKVKVNCTFQKQQTVFILFTMESVVSGSFNSMKAGFFAKGSTRGKNVQARLKKGVLGLSGKVLVAGATGTTFVRSS